MEAANWDGANIHRTSLKLGLRSEASAPVREGDTARAGDRGPGGRDPADDRAVRGARCCRARSTSAARARRRRRSGSATPGSRACSGARSRASAASGSSRALEFTTAARRRRARRHRARLPPGDVTREADLIEEVARHRRAREAAGDAALAPRRSGRLTARSACAGRRGRARGAGPPRDRGLELRRPRARRPAAARATPAPARGARQPDVGRAVACCARRCSARCSTPRGTTAPAAPRPCACSRRARCTCPGRGEPPREPYHARGGADRAGAPAELARADPRRGRLLRGQGGARGPARRAPRAVGRRAPRTSRSCTRAARRRSSSPARRRVARRDPSARRRRLGSARHRGRVRARPRRRRREPPTAPPTRTSAISPTCARTSRWSSPSASPRRR